MAAMPTPSRRTASGQYEVRDPALRSEILKLRNDPTANAVMAGAFTKANAVDLERAARPRAERRRTLHRAFSRRRRRGAVDHAGREQSERQGRAIISAMPRRPIARSSTIARPARARSVAQVRNILTARYDVARRSQAAATSVAQAATGPDNRGRCRPAPDTAGIAGALSPPPAERRAAMQPGHRRLCRAHRRRRRPSRDRRSSRCSTACSPTPTAPRRSAPRASSAAVGRAEYSAAASARRTAVAGGMLDLFKDLPG